MHLQGSIQRWLIGASVLCAAFGWSIAGQAAPQAKDATQNGGAGPGMTTNVPGALPGIHLITPVPNGQWTLPAGDFANTRYSPLSQINATNVQNLKLVGSMSIGIPHGFEGQPLVVGSTMYVVPPLSERSDCARSHQAGLPCEVEVPAEPRYPFRRHCLL
jgi:glucose dehydrogenase